MWLILASIATFHSLLLLLDRHFAHFANSNRYTNFLRKTGFDHPRLFQIRWTTQSFNRIFVRTAQCHPRLLSIWFSLGAIVSSLLIIPSMVLLVKTLLTALVPEESADGSPEERIVLQPVLPGVNLPLSEIGYYLATLLLCSVIHEAGHAVAAAVEEVRVVGSGTLVLFVLPAAFVDLPTDQLMSLRPWRQLKIFAAGVWHNIVLAAFAYLLLFSIPQMANSLYRTGEGVSVISVRQDSTLTGPSGLVAGDEITDINGCQVQDLNSWKDCLVKAVTDSQSGVCVVETFLRDKTRSGNNSTYECCSEAESKSSICFNSNNKSDTDSKQYYCLPVRAALEEGGNCREINDCKEGQKCVVASLSGQVRLMRVLRKSKKDFLFVGSPAEVFQAAHVSGYLPKSLPSWLPGCLELLAHYVASFSGALAVLNVVPCFLLDGHHISRALVDILVPDEKVRREFGATVALTFTVVGTALLASNILVGLWQLF